MFSIDITLSPSSEVHLFHFPLLFRFFIVQSSLLQCYGNAKDKEKSKSKTSFTGNLSSARSSTSTQEETIEEGAKLPTEMVILVISVAHAFLHFDLKMFLILKKGIICFLYLPDKCCSQPKEYC